MAILLIGAGAQAQSLGWQLTEKQDDALTDESITTATLVDGASRRARWFAARAASSRPTAPWVYILVASSRACATGLTDNLWLRK
jgi:hypothetical protein